MTRKHFQAIAITLGAQMRDHEPLSEGQMIIWTTASLLAADFRAASPSFDTQRFLDFVAEVATYRRDLDGKAVAA